MRVAATGGHHLQILRTADAALRIEHAAAGTRYIEEAFQRSLAGIAAGRDQNKYLARLAVLLAAQDEQIRQKLQRHVLEGERRSMPELQGMRPAAHAFERGNRLAVKARAVSARNGLLELLLLKIRQETGEHRIGALLIAHGRHRHNLLSGEGRERFGDI